MYNLAARDFKEASAFTGLISNIRIEQEIIMKKFALFHIGFEMPTREIMDAWNTWFQSIADRQVEPGNGLGPGREITRSGTRELSFDKDAITGYNVITAEDIDEAEEVAKSCPFITAVRVYEIRSM